jgi:hypothetical protein
MNWVDKYHVIRRLLLAIFTYFFLRITFHIFCDGVVLDAFKVSAYGIFTGVETFLIKFYYDSRNIEIKNNRNNNK